MGDNLVVRVRCRFGSRKGCQHFSGQKARQPNLNYRDMVNQDKKPEVRIAGNR
jgi:hypothetical protein